MPVSLKKAEVTAVVEILKDDTYLTPEAMARDILKLTYRLMQERDWWAAGWQDPPAPGRPALNYLYGPYPYEREAVKALASGVAQGPTGATRGVFKILGIADAEKRLISADDLNRGLDPLCVCGHRKSNHDIPGSKFPGCYAPRDVCRCRAYEKQGEA